MKIGRIIIVSIMFLFVPFLLWSVQTVPYPAFMVVGYIDSQVDLSVTIDESVLPIDFLDEQVKFNSTPASHVSGVKFGSYTVVSNIDFTLNITHTPFNLKAPTEEDNQTRPLKSIDYVLYAFTDVSTGQYSYCYGSDSSSSPKEINMSKNINNNSIINLVNYGLYLSLDDDANQTKAKSLQTGIYESTIYFIMETE